MKIFLVSLFTCLLSIPVFAQVPTTGATVNTGVVTAIDRETGSITIHSEQSQSPVQFSGLDKATIQLANGTPATFADVALSQLVTIQYEIRNDVAVASKLLLPNPREGRTLAPDAPVRTPATEALNTSAAQDGDITTAPGRAALIDGDITTQPGQAATIDGDITTRPGKTHPQDPDVTKTPAD